MLKNDYAFVVLESLLFFNRLDLYMSSPSLLTWDLVVMVNGPEGCVWETCAPPTAERRTLPDYHTR